MADEKELGIKITGDIGDIQDKLSTLVGDIGGLQDKTVDITANVNDTQLENFSTELKTIESTQINIPVDDTQIQKAATEAATATTNIEQIAAAANDANVGLDSLNSQTIAEAAAHAADLGNTLNSIDSTTLNEAASAAGALGVNFEEASKGANDLSNKTEEASESTNALNDAVQGFAALGLGAIFADAVNSAGNFTDSWSRIGTVMNQTDMNMQQLQADWQTSISQMSESTGRSAGDIRQHIINMGLSGVSSKEVIVSAFDGIAAAAFRTGNSVGIVDTVFKNVVATGRVGRGTLQQLGLSTDDLGMSTADLTQKLQGMDATQRAAYLSQILNSMGAAEANAQYKQSWEHVLDSLSRAWDYISRIFGGLVLPIVIPVLNTLSGVLSTVAGEIDKLPGPLKSVLGVVTLVVGGFAFLALTMGPLITAWNALNIAEGIAVVRKAAVTAATVAQTASTTLATVAQSAFNVTQDLGIVGLLRSVAQFAISVISMGAYAIAAGVATAAQWALNIAMDANPIGIIILALAGLAAGVIWAYQNVEPFRNAINWLWEGLQQLGAYIMGGLQEAWDYLQRFFTDPLGAIEELLNMINYFAIQAVLVIADWAWEFVDAGVQGATDFVDGILDYIGDLPDQIWDYLTNVVTYVMNWQYVLIKAAVDTGKGIFNGIIDFIKTIPDKMYQYGQDILQRLVDGLWEKMGPFKDILNYISEHWPKSPPKLGPLSEITSVGMGNWISEVMQGGIDAAGTFNLNNIAIPAASTAGVVNQTRIGGKTEITVDMRGAVIRNESDAERYGKIAGQAAAKEVDSDAINNGVSVINYLR
jgi:hypothetical protein